MLLFTKHSHIIYSLDRNLAIGIGIQNFPEGLAVSLPLRGAGVSVWMAFWWGKTVGLSCNSDKMQHHSIGSWMCIRYGQLSGMVEPIAGLLGAFAVVLAEPLLPYALAFAAGAMVYVVVDDIIPEAQVRWATENFKDWQTGAAFATGTV